MSATCVILPHRRIRRRTTLGSPTGSGDAGGGPAPAGTSDDLGGDERLAVPALAGPVLSARAAAAAVAGALRHQVPHRRDQQRLLPAAGAGHVRRLAGADPAG